MSVLSFFRKLFGLNDVVHPDAPQVPVVTVPKPDPSQPDIVVNGEDVIEYYDITGLDLDQEATFINKETKMSNDAIVIEEIKREVTEALKLVDGLLANPDVKAFPASYRKILTGILAYVPNYADGRTATAALDWYEKQFQLLVDGVFAGKIKNVLKPVKFDPAGRIVHANQAIEWAYKNLLNKGINLHDFGSTHNF